MARAPGLLFLLVCSLTLYSCTGSPPTATTGSARLLNEPTTASQPIPAAPSSPTSSAELPVIPVPTPELATLEPAARDAAWVGDRVQAVIALYGISPEGAEALARLDVRWMRDEPGFFGSYGYKSWTGIGEARPTGVMHELSHSYFGLFPVTDYPELEWDAAKGKDLSPAIEMYHSDMLEFMRQPPDSFEPLRERLRNLPELSSDNLGPLLHTIEADAVHTTAGDLNLLPPILRKYWDQFISPGPFLSWYEALGWYNSLPPAEMRLADRYLGFQHVDLKDYGDLETMLATQISEEIEAVLLGEEHQRLRDFAEVFDLLVGSPEQREDFKFWRRYLRDKVQLHKIHPQLLAALDTPGAGQIVSALGFLGRLEAQSRNERTDLLNQELDAHPFLAHFLPVLDDRTLLELFTSGAPLPAGATLKGTAVFVGSLQELAPHIERILEAGRSDTSSGADELRAFLDTVDSEKDKELLDLFFEVFQGSDESTAREVTAALDDATLRSLLTPVPARLHILLSPARLPEALDITLDSSPNELAKGIEDMVRHPSGNFRIDEPFVEEMYRVVASRVGTAPQETLEAIAGSPFPMEGFISGHPDVAVALLATDLGVAARLIKASDTVLFPPARFVYRLIHADPDLAAQLTALLDEQEESELVIEILAHFAYDAERLESLPGLPISLERDARFLERLLEANGAGWLEDRIGTVAEVYGQRMARKEASPEFLASYQRTLREAVRSLDGEAATTLQEILGRVFRVSR